MVQTANHQETNQTLKGKILTSYDYLLKHQDNENALKVKQLAKKLANKEFAIAFCGHFSAGKSSMINRMIGDNLLPSSPIPTSANLVKVMSGEEYAKVFFKNERPRLYLAPYDYNLVKNYCKDGDQIEEVVISHQSSHLPPNTVILDTPGIDSADDAHRIATESAIHLADLIFYIMDYNHVQSELNFLFTKELTDAGKEVYLVINQIDKHLDAELSFEDFKNSVANSFASWGVKPADIFYTSLKKEDHQFNQFSELREFTNDRLKDKDAFLLQSIDHSLMKIIKDHMEKERKAEEVDIEPYKQILSELSENGKEDLLAVCSKLEEGLQAAEGGVDQAEKDFDDEVREILKNAYLMPFQTREYAEAYLESCQPEFKVGIFFSKQKTHEEKQMRLQQFYEDILEKAKSQLEWHLRELLLRFLKQKRIESKELIGKAQAFDVQFPMDLLERTVKTGARLSGDYVLNYTNDVADEIKRTAKNHLADIKTGMMAELKERNQRTHEKLAEELKGMERYLSALEHIKKFESDQLQLKMEVEKLMMQAETLDIEDPFDLFAQEEEEFEVVSEGTESAVQQVEKQNAIPDAPKKLHVKEAPSRDARDKLHVTAEKLKGASQLIERLPGFKKLSHELAEKAERLDHKGFTVALFGAFSAGKSSFANALMGEKVLPVSPNPTTAAINKIKPVNETFSHGTVLVKLKEQKSLLDDVNRALQIFDISAKNLTDALKAADQIHRAKGEENPAEKTHYAFLQAFKKGFPLFGDQLGEVLETTFADFSSFAANEEKSCFVEWIELYYDCELTRKGITLVDTPGADSINARHTGVAFDFIKNADAILFVTYYNHAFSKADREFLIQLGRVKDSFQLDKMFFVINAIDLAENDEEKDTVIDYVNGQLVKYGVRNPHLYSLSSLNALKEKVDPDISSKQSGMDQFETSFYQFIANDLTDLTIAASETELQRIYNLVGNLLQSATEDMDVKEQKREHIRKEKGTITAILTEQSVQILQSRLSQEIEELIYYIKQRVFFRFSDFFKEAFNPAVLRDDGRNLKKVLHAALRELVEGIGFDFAQEMRATTVRLDRFTEKITDDLQESLKEAFLEVNGGLSFSGYMASHVQEMPEIEFQPAFVNIDYQRFAKTMSYFKNPKSFFEKNEKKLMSEEIYRLLDSPADEYLANETNRLKSYYTELCEKMFAGLLEHITDQVDDFYLSLLSALDGGIGADQLTEIQQKIKGFLS